MKTQDLAQDILSNCIAGRTHQIARVISASYDSALADTGVTSHQLTLLSMICKMQPVPPKDMLPYLKMDQSTLSRNLERMADKGWLSSARSEDDQRHKRFALTVDGESALRVAYERWTSAQQDTVDRLGSEGFHALKEIANALNPLLPND